MSEDNEEFGWDSQSLSLPYDDQLLDAFDFNGDGVWQIFEFDSALQAVGGDGVSIGYLFDALGLGEHNLAGVSVEFIDHDDFCSIMKDSTVLTGGFGGSVFGGIFGGAFMQDTLDPVPDGPGTAGGFLIGALVGSIVGVLIWESVDESLGCE